MRRIILTNVRFYSFFQTVWLIHKKLKMRYWKVFKEVLDTCAFDDPLVIDLTNYNPKLEILMHKMYDKLGKLNGTKNVTGYGSIPVLPMVENYEITPKVMFYMLDSFILVEDSEYTSPRTKRTKMVTKITGRIDLFKFPAVLVKHD